MAFGLPVLGSDAGGTREIIGDGGTGLPHPVGEAGMAVFAENLERLRRDREWRRGWGEPAGPARSPSSPPPLLPRVENMLAASIPGWSASAGRQLAGSERG